MNSYAVALGKILFERAIVLLLAAGTLKPGNVLRIFCSLQQFLVILDWNNNGDGLAVPSNDFRFVSGRFHWDQSSILSTSGKPSPVDSLLPSGRYWLGSGS